MLYDAADDPASLSPEELRMAYESELRGVIESQGVDTVATMTGVEPTTLDAIASGPSAASGDSFDADPDEVEPTELTLDEAAAILAVSEEYPDKQSIVLEVRDHLLMGMTTGVLDVDTIAANVDLDFGGQEIQQAIEGRMPMTLSEMAAIHAFIAERND